MLQQMLRQVLACAAGLALLASVDAAAQGGGGAYPTKPIRLLVGFPPGGTTDVVARIVGAKLSEQLGQQVVIENRPGAAGNIAAAAAAKSAPDGHTLFLGVIGINAINPSLYTDIPFDTLRDFEAISQLSSVPQIMLVNPSVPAKTVMEFIDYAKSRPGQVTFGSGGSGTAVHLAGELFKTSAGIDMLHIPYKGTSPAMVDLLGGRIDLMFDQILTGLPYAQSGKLRILGVTTSKRTPAAPDIPTIAEAGLPGYNVTTWHGLLAPAGTPKEIIARLHAETVKALRSPDVQERFRANGADAVSSTPEEFREFMRSEIERWKVVVKTSGAKVE